MADPPADMEPIIRRAQKGDQEAITVLYQTYAQQVYRYIAYRVTTQADAEDLTAEVFVRMVKGISRYRITGAPFEAWLYRIASARVADWYRRRYRRQQVELSETMAAQGPLPEEQLQQEQELDVLRDALQQLTTDQQTVLFLRFVERRSHEDAAAMMQKSVTAVKSIQHRALNRLASILGSSGKIRHYLRGDHE